MSQWFRFYGDAINNPKVLKLSDAMFRAWVTLLCLASQHEGILPSAADIALVLRMKAAKVAEWLTSLTAAGLLDCGEDGAFRPHNWNARQYKSDVSTERVKRFRQRKGNVSSAVSETAPEQSRADTEQSRAPAVSNLERVLRTDLAELLGPSRPLDLSRAGVWLSKGYSSTLIIEVVSEVLARKPDVSSLNYFDAVLEERHAAAPESPSDIAAKRDWDAAARLWKSNGRWPRGHGSDPDSPACQCPPDVLAKHGIQRFSMRRMDA